MPYRVPHSCGRGARYHAPGLATPVRMRQTVQVTTVRISLLPLGVGARFVRCPSFKHNSCASM